MLLEQEITEIAKESYAKGLALFSACEKAIPVSDLFDYKRPVDDAIASKITSGEEYKNGDVDIDLSGTDVPNFIWSIVKKYKEVNNLRLVYGRDMYFFFPANAYFPTRHTVRMSPLPAFTNLSYFINVLFHELVHSTATSLGNEIHNLDHDSKQLVLRNNRFSMFHHSLIDYTREEIVAEAGAIILAARLGVLTDDQRKNNLEYIKSWTYNGLQSKFANDAFFQLEEGVSLEGYLAKLRIKECIETAHLATDLIMYPEQYYAKREKSVSDMKLELMSMF